MGLADHSDSKLSTTWSGLFERGGKYYLLPTNLPRTTSKLTMFKMMLRSQFTVTFVYFLICFYIDTLMQSIVQRRADYTKTMSPCFRNYILPDIGFDVFENYTSEHLADHCLVFVVVFTSARFLATNFMRWTILRRWILLLSTLFLIRAFAIISTMLPNPYKRCITTAKSTDSVFYNALMVMLLQRRTCADVLFSGHTVNLTICALVWQTYSHVSPITDIEPLSSCFRMPLTSSNRWDLNRMTLTKWAIWCLVVGGFILILITRLHYTADVYIGFVLTCLLWKLYHHYIRTAHERSNFFNKLICWMEQNADDLHPDTDSSSLLPTIYKRAVNHHSCPCNNTADDSDFSKAEIIVSVRPDANLSSEDLCW